MGVYSIGRNYSRDFDNAGIIECQYEPGLEAALNIVAESELNYNKLMQAVAKDELGYLQENGVEMVYESGTASGFIEKLKAFFLKIWEKIKGLFRKFFAMFDAMTKDDDKFLSKYKTKLTKVSVPSDFKFKGYKFTIDQGAKLVANNDTAIGSLIAEAQKRNDDKLNDFDMDEINEKIRGILIGDKGNYTAKEFSTALFEKLRNGESEKEEIENVTVGQIVTVLGSTKNLRKNADNNFKKMKKAIEEDIKRCDRAEKDILNDSNRDTDAKSVAISQYHREVEILRALLNANQLANGAMLTAIKQYGQQWKMVAAKLLKYMHESVEMDGDVVSESHVSNVDFI